MNIKRKKTKRIMLGGVPIGGGAPISVQSMTKTPTRSVRSTIRQIERLAGCGCEIIRVAVPDDDAARAIRRIRREISIPLVADVHFNYRIALTAMEMGADGVRINPGNIGKPERLVEIAREAASRKVPIRVGVNSGSLEKELIRKHRGPTPRALAESALASVRRIEDAGHSLIKISVKASSVLETIEAYRLVSKQCRYPLHVGVTEAGPPLIAAVRSAAAIGHLLLEGIGDTIRVSATGDPEVEVEIAKELLQSLGLRKFGPTLVSCPTCGRCDIDMLKLVRAVQRSLHGIREGIKVAVMGCMVNGPGEAREADIGVAGGKGVGVIFKKGKIVRKVREEDILRALIDEIRDIDARSES